MDVQLKELIEKIKNEGVKSAEQQAEEIIKKAESEANSIIQKAKKESETIISNAKDESEKFTQSSKEALKQAGRDLILKVESELTKIFDSIIQKETESLLKGSNLEQAVLSVFKSWKGSTDNLNILLSEEDSKLIEASLFSKLKDLLKNEIEIKPFSNINSGFRVGEKDGSAYFNFTSEGIAELIAEFLNPKLKDIVKEAVGQE